ncbi:hypothetical protein HY357_03880 [Candidatus Roizmanbacteria bacterium]|nr:hypothetical protein [Candidatus Roizmanbacteria bacterium]
MHVVSALLEKNHTTLFAQIKRLAPYFKTFQIDIADGRFVPNRTVQIEEISEFLPHYHLPASPADRQTTYHKLSFDFHLMVRDYEAEIRKLEKLRNFIKIKNIFVHYSLHPNIYYLTSNFQHLTFGLVLDPEDSVDKLTKNYKLRTINCIQIMSINPGFQGQEFIPETLKKIEQLRAKDYRNKIYLDGAINQDTLSTIRSLEYKPDYLCIGSFLTKTMNLKQNVNYLRSLQL